MRIPRNTEEWNQLEELGYFDEGAAIRRHLRQVNPAPPRKRRRMRWSWLLHAGLLIAGALITYLFFAFLDHQSRP